MTDAVPDSPAHPTFDADADLDDSTRRTTRSITFGEEMRDQPLAVERSTPFFTASSTSQISQTRSRSRWS